MPRVLYCFQHTAVFIPFSESNDPDQPVTLQQKLAVAGVVVTSPGNGTQMRNRVAFTRATGTENGYTHYLEAGGRK